MFTSIQIQLIGPLPNQSDLLCQEVKKVHKVSPSSENISSDINLEFEENSPFQEGIISEAYQRPDKSFFQEPQELNDHHKHQ